MIAQAPHCSRIFMIYCGILLLCCACVTGIDYILNQMMSRSGGLGNLGTRSILSTLQTVLPIVHTLVLMGLDLGLAAAMLRISRGLYTSPQTLRTGISRFFGILRLNALKLLIFMGLGTIAMYAGMLTFFLTPLSNATTSVLEPLIAQGLDLNALLEAFWADEAMLSAFYKSLLPMYLLLAGFFLVLAVPIAYRMRCAVFTLLDDPRIGGIQAIWRSFKMTKYNCTAFFKLDLSFWWYHILCLLSAALCYTDTIGSLLGIDAPWLTDYTYLYYGAYLVSQCVLFWFFRAKVDVSGALIYDALCPKEDNPQGVVLGNIFQM